MDTATDAATAVAAPIASAAAPLTHVLGDALDGVTKSIPMMKDINAATFKPKGILVAMVGLCLVIAIGAVFYAHAESMKWIDAVYFTVVTATTVGFGDYCPETMSGKVFTLFYVPFSVVSVAGLINHVAAVPLETRRENLEKYVLAQFADHVTQGDFDDIRRSAAISDDRSIRANDFLIAMALRLGYLNPDDCHQIKRIFDRLDVSGDGELTEQDIQTLISASPAAFAPRKNTDQPLIAATPVKQLNFESALAEGEEGGDSGAETSSNPLADDSKESEEGGDNGAETSSNPLADDSKESGPRAQNDDL